MEGPRDDRFPESEVRRLQTLDVWIGWLRIAGFLGLILLYRLLEPSQAEDGWPRWELLAGATAVYGALWLVIMPRAKEWVRRLVGGLSLLGDAALITAVPLVTGVAAEAWTPLWTLVAVHYVVRFGWPGGAAVWALAAVSLLAQERWGWTGLPLAAAREAVPVLSKGVPLLSLAVLVLLLGRLVEHDYDLRHRLRLMAIRDGLTGLYNHRHFYDVLEREISRAARDGGAVGLVMIDLDQFKSLNDAYGHVAGDKVLTQVAAVIAGSIRLHDSAFRYGGEEFAVILPGATPAVAENVAARLCNALAAHPFAYRKVTASVGWSHYPVLATNSEELVRQADEAVYLAKEAGGNRVLGYMEPVA